jgi:hypothetical protein
MIPTRRNPMSVHKALLPALSALALVATVAGGAKADGQAVTSAKFNCGAATSTNSTDVVPGTYATAINIHNPQQSTTVQFNKTIVQAFEEGAPFGNPVTATDTLRPGQAETVDCPVIYRALRISGTPPIEGFVEIVILNSSYGNEFLDVVGKYTAAPSGGQVSAMAIVVYSASNIGR